MGDLDSVLSEDRQHLLITYVIDRHLIHIVRKNGAVTFPPPSLYALRGLTVSMFLPGLRDHL